MEEFLKTLFVTSSVTQSLLVLVTVIAMGIWAAETLRYKQFGLGVTWILFVGIFAAACGMKIDPVVCGFAKDFGLILFVYSIGLQVGPSFFSSFGKGGLQLNMLAMSVVLLGCLTAIVLHVVTGIDMSTMIGIMSGAVTNTPSLGAAQQAFADAHDGVADSSIATGYAVAYPLGVIGIILSIAAISWIYRISLSKEEERLLASQPKQKEPVCLDILLTNPRLKEKIGVLQLKRFLHVDFVISRVLFADGTESMVDKDTRFGEGDRLRVLTDDVNIPTLSLLGDIEEHTLKSDEKTGALISRKIVVTQQKWNGKRIGSLNLRTKYHVTITRVNRAGINLLATDDLVLQIADRIVVVGEESDVRKVTDIFGNELKKLDVPNLLPIFMGIGIGIVLGLLPIPIPGMSQRFKLGLAGGALISAIIVGRFGPYYRLVTFATTSANRMLREVGLSLFLAAVGLSAGGDFLKTVLDGGYMWILWGFLITIIPLLVVGTIGYKIFHVNYFSLTGMMSGAMTDPPALAYSASLSSNNDQANVAYATVYPLTMFLRVMMAQLMVLFLC